MVIDRDTLDDYLYLWISYREKEFKDVSWQGMSITGKCCEACKTGIFSHGTIHQALDFEVPEIIDITQKALLQLSQSYRQIIKTEYSDGRSQKKKAKVLRLSCNQYRARLCRARQMLMKLI